MPLTNTIISVEPQHVPQSSIVEYYSFPRIKLFMSLKRIQQKKGKIASYHKKCFFMSLHVPFLD